MTALFAAVETCPTDGALAWPDAVAMVAIVAFAALWVWRVSR